jgi:hypothetical protein
VADADGGGTIDTEEFHALLQSAGSNAAHAKQLFAKLDKDGSFPGLQPQRALCLARALILVRAAHHRRRRAHA